MLDTAAAPLPLRKLAAGEAAAAEAAAAEAAAAKAAREVAKVAVKMAAAGVKTNFPNTGCLSSLKKAASYNRYHTSYCACIRPHHCTDTAVKAQNYLIEADYNVLGSTYRLITSQVLV